MCELLLRGPQTPGELRGRASRMHAFTSPAEVKIVLDALAARQPDPYAVELPRAAGCKENRFAQTLGDVPIEVLRSAPVSVAPVRAAPVPARESAPGGERRIEELEKRIADIEAQLIALRGKPN